MFKRNSFSITGVFCFAGPQLLVAMSMAPAFASSQKPDDIIDVSLEIPVVQVDVASVCLCILLVSTLQTDVICARRFQTRL